MRDSSNIFVRLRLCLRNPWIWHEVETHRRGFLGWVQISWWALPVPRLTLDERVLGFALRILSLWKWHGNDNNEEGIRENNNMEWSGVPVFCLNFCSFSFAIFTFLWPSATCRTKPLVSFSSSNLCSAYLRIISAVCEQQSKHMFQNKNSQAFVVKVV